MEQGRGKVKIASLTFWRNPCQAHHRIRYSEEALQSCVKFASQYIQEQTAATINDHQRVMWVSQRGVATWRAFQRSACASSLQIIRSCILLRNMHLYPLWPGSLSSGQGHRFAGWDWRARPVEVDESWRNKNSHDKCCHSVISMDFDTFWYILSFQNLRIFSLKKPDGAGSWPQFRKKPWNCAKNFEMWRLRRRWPCEPRCLVVVPLARGEWYAWQVAPLKVSDILRRFNLVSIWMVHVS